MSGINRARLAKFLTFTEARSFNKNKPCVFLSHITIDKRIAKKIGDYLMENGDVDIYLDSYDDKLQQATNDGNLVRQYIEDGLEDSTHIICLVSENTVRSWWVPYELGFSKRAGKEIATLTLKGTETLPDYLKIGAVLRGTKSLNQYLKSISQAVRKSMILESIYPDILSHTQSRHPLA